MTQQQQKQSTSKQYCSDLKNKMLTLNELNQCKVQFDKDIKIINNGSYLLAVNDACTALEAQQMLLVKNLNYLVIIANTLPETLAQKPKREEFLEVWKATRQFEAINKFDEPYSDIARKFILSLDDTTQVTVLAKNAGGSVIKSSPQIQRQMDCTHEFKPFQKKSSVKYRLYFTLAKDGKTLSNLSVASNLNSTRPNLKTVKSWLRPPNNTNQKGLLGTKLYQRLELENSAKYLAEYVEDGDIKRKAAVEAINDQRDLYLSNRKVIDNIIDKLPLNPIMSKPQGQSYQTGVDRIMKKFHPRFATIAANFVIELEKDLLKNPTTQKREQVGSIASRVGGGTKELQGKGKVVGKITYTWEFRPATSQPGVYRIYFNMTAKGNFIKEVCLTNFDHMPEKKNN